MFFFFKQKTAYEMRISDWSSDVCSSDIFTLVNRIAPLIRDGRRLVIVASGGHRFADVDLADPNFEAQPYDPWVAYGRSKTANILFAVEFDRRHKARAIRAAAVHPGAIATDLGRDVPPEQMAALFKQITGAAKAAGERSEEHTSIAQGAATPVWAAAVAEETGRASGRERGCTNV